MVPIRLNSSGVPELYKIYREVLAVEFHRTMVFWGNDTFGRICHTRGHPIVVMTCDIHIEDYRSVMCNNRNDNSIARP
jgi:hypothetical protein